MKLPSHVLTKLSLLGAVGTVGAVTTCDPRRREPEPVACSVEYKSDDTPLSDVVRMTHDPMPVVAPLPLQHKHLPLPPPPSRITPKTKPPRTFSSSCGHPVLIDPSKPVLLKACGKG